MKIAVINSSFRGMKPADRIYNLAVDKIAHYYRLRGDQVYAGEWESFIGEFASSQGHADKYFFSVIFTWDIPGMIQAVNQVRSWHKPVEIGGPAATFMPQYIEKMTGIKPHTGINYKYESITGDFQLTFTSRGCPHGCRFCGVRRVEPDAVEYEQYPIAPMVGDNNITATSWEHQKHFVSTYNKHGFGINGGTRVVDINSGFDVRFFQEDHYALYSTLKIKTWRFAFDTLAVWDDVWRVATMMKHHGLDRHEVTFYCLMGFPGTVADECRFRMDSLISLGMNPYPMRFIPLNSLTHKYVAPGWTEDVLFKMQTYYGSPFLWMADTYDNFRPGKNKQIVKAKRMNPHGEQYNLENMINV